jgi:hypothetical protein
MAAEALVRSEIDAGLNLIRALDASGFGVQAALWLYMGDNDTWKLIIAYRGGKDQIGKKYLDAATAVADWRERHPNEPVLDLGRVRIVPAEDKLISGLRPVIHLDGLGEVRFSHNLVNGIYVEDALIHRLAA